MFVRGKASIIGLLALLVALPLFAHNGNDSACASKELKNRVKDGLEHLWRLDDLVKKAWGQAIKTGNKKPFYELKRCIMEVAYPQGVDLSFISGNVFMIDKKTRWTVSTFYMREYSLDIFMDYTLIAPVPQHVKEFITETIHACEQYCEEKRATLGRYYNHYHTYDRECAEYKEKAKKRGVYIMSEEEQKAEEMAKKKAEEMKQVIQELKRGKIGPHLPF